MTVEEAADLLRLSVRTVREKMRLGHFRLGVHYFKIAHSRPLFKRCALIQLIEGNDHCVEPKSTLVPFRMRRGYNLGG